MDLGRNSLANPSKSAFLNGQDTSSINKLFKEYNAWLASYKSTLNTDDYRKFLSLKVSKILRCVFLRYHLHWWIHSQVYKGLNNNNNDNNINILSIYIILNYCQMDLPKLCLISLKRVQFFSGQWFPVANLSPVWFRRWRGRIRRRKSKDIRPDENNTVGYHKHLYMFF